MHSRWSRFDCQRLCQRLHAERLNTGARTMQLTCPPNSAMYTLPALSKAVVQGPFKNAFVAAPPSPLLPAVPCPAKVVVTLVLGLTTSTRWFMVSA